MKRTVGGATAVGLGGACALAFTVACMGEVAGERSSSGACPAGEVCSEATPGGLIFVGQTFYDEETVRLGPMMEGGVFEVGFRDAFGEALDEVRVEIERAGSLQLVDGDGTFGTFGTDGSEADTYDIAGWRTFRGARPGRDFVRVVDAETGELHDRLEIEVVRVQDVTVGHAWDPDRDYVRAGCEEWLGVKLLADGQKTRLFDQNMTVVADEGELTPDPVMWDCVRFVPPAGPTTTVTVRAGGSEYTRTFPVRTLEEDGLTECPDIH